MKSRSAAAGTVPGTTVLIGLILVLAVLAVFAQICTFDFSLWDDPQTVSQNPLLNPPTLEHSSKFWKEPIESLYIPVTYSLWAGAAAISWLDVPDAHGYHLNPYVFHGLNLVLHLASALLVWRLLWSLVKNEWAAMAGALVFALHPLQVEAVAWVSGAKDLLYALLCLLALVSFMEFLQAEGHIRRISLLVLGTLCFVLAVLSKPTAIILPLLVFALAWGQGVQWRRGDVAAVSSWLILAAGGAVLTRLVQTGSRAGPEPPEWFRPFVAADAVWFYLSKLTAPFALTIDYGRSPQWLRATGWWKFTWLAPATVVVGLVMLPAPRHLRLAALLFLIPLLPVLGLVTFNFQFYSTVADHYVYLSTLGVGLVIAYGIAKSPPKAATVLLAVVLLLGWGAISFVQAQHWQNSRKLFTHALQVNPQSFIAHYNLGVLDEMERQAPSAIQQFRSAIQLRPEYVPAHAELGRLLLAVGSIDEGLSELGRSLELTKEQEPSADLAEAYVNLGRAALRSGRTGQAKALAEQGLRLNPQSRPLQQLFRDAVK